MAIGMLRRDLSPQKQQMLAALSAHPGWAIVKNDLIQDALNQASNEMVSLNSSDPEYVRRLSAIQVEAHAVQTFSQALIRSVEVHAQAAVDQDNS
jgi:hypothetical protein